MFNVEEGEDVEVTTSPLIDDNYAASAQGQSYLGYLTNAFNWMGDVHPQSKRTVPLTVAKTANEYFADYQPQNSSVFSMFDDMTIRIGNDKWQLCDAKVSYTIVGWHSDWSTDPLYPPVDGQSASDRIKACSLSLDLDGINNPTQFTDPSKDNQISTLGGLKTFCHGSMFDVKFSQTTTGPTQHGGYFDELKYPGDDIQAEFASSHPLSVGTNDMDALFGWLRAQDGDQSANHTALMKLQSFVLDTNDDLDSQLQAQDLIATNNFIALSGGKQWHFATPGKQASTANADAAPAIPSSDDIDKLKTLNNYQALLDARVRERNSLKTQMFDLWWKCLVDQGKSSTSLSIDQMKSARNDLRIRLDDNLYNADTGQTVVKEAIAVLSNDFQPNINPIQTIAASSFYIQQDPTIFIAGMSPKWPQNFNDDLKVRGWDQVQREDNEDLNMTKIESFYPYRLDHPTADAIFRILNEGYNLRQNLVYSPEAPLYYDDQDRFDGNNGWFPLFIEWEVEYYHLPWEYWEFKPCGPESRYGYCIKEGIDLGAPSISTAQDYRVLNGRTALLPQAASSLEATLRQVYSKINPDELDEMIDQNARDELLVAVRSFDYLSTPMQGFTDQLTTRMQGSHYTPLHYDATQKKMVPDGAAKTVGDMIGMTEDDFFDMDTAVTTTPFASLQNVPADTAKTNPFKPCMHGQLRFTKMNIVDKFGQIVNGIRTVVDPKGTTSHTPLFPCLGESYSVQELSSQAGTANTVLPRNDGLNTFVQLPPSINQQARINAQYVKSGSNGWGAIEEWENPVRGWLVIDYANTSIQIFSADGTFVREYSVVTGTVTARPFPADVNVGQSLNYLLLELLEQFGKDGWLLRFFQNITRTIDATQSSPSHYAESTLSVLGRPLALVTFGFSLELAQPPLANQSTIPTTSSQGHQSVLNYAFPTKVGDKDNVFDGLIGFFGGDWASFDLSTFLSYHDPDPAKQPGLLYHTPFYVDPSKRADYLDATDSYLNPLAAIVDPFTPVHVYSALLPIKQLAIPSWCISDGLGRIASFFKTGPTLLANDVPAFDPNKEIAQDYRLGDPDMPKTNGTIPIPSVSMADYKWLQPYWVNANGAGKTKYNTMDIEQPSEKPLWQTPPYVVTEGYLQMAKPFTAPSSAPPKEQAPSP